MISNQLSTTHVVPRVSILGPLLFSIFTADLPTILTADCSIHMYADDTQLYMSSSASFDDYIMSELNVNISLVNQWPREDGLILNPNKCTALYIGTISACAKAMSSMSVELKLNDSIINMSEEEKNLIIDNRLSFEKHVNIKCSICYFKLKSLYTFKYVLPSDTKQDSIVKYKINIILRYNIRVRFAILLLFIIFNFSLLMYIPLSKSVIENQHWLNYTL